MIHLAFGYDGSVRIKADLNHSNFDMGIVSMTGSIKKFSGTLMKLASAVGIAFGVGAIVNFGKEAVKAASALNNAWLGLESIVSGQGRSFSKAKAFINDYISDGLVPLENAVTAYKNLAARGYSTEQIEKTLTALKDAAAFGRQASYSLGDAVSSATEGLKNENSILVDNAGVTKNVAKMWEDYANSIGVSAQSLTQEQKIQAEVNGILEETRFQTGDAAKLVNTYSGQIAMLSYNFQQLKVEVGNAIMPVVQAVLPGINAIISALTKLAKVFAQVTALLFGKTTEVSTNTGVASSAASAADATDQLAESTEGAGTAAKKAEKEMKGVLAGFDELNILADQTASSLEDASGGLDMSGADVELPEVDTEGEIFADAEISPKLRAEIDALRDSIGRIWDVFKESWERNGPGVIEAAKNALESIYGLLKSIGRAFTEAFTGGAGAEWLDSIYRKIESILNLISAIADAFRTAWDNSGTEYIESVLFRSTEVRNMWTSIRDAFIEAWSSGVGVEICEHILHIMTNINNIIGTLAEKFREAWEANENGVAIWTAILEIVESLLGFVERLTEATLIWAQGLDLEPLVTSFRGLLEALEPLIDVILDGLAYVYENVLLPLGKWAVEELAPVGIDLLTAAVQALTEVLEALEPFATWLWENFLQPMAEWTGEIIIGALETITDLLNRFSAWVSENESLVQDIAIVISSFAAAWTLVNTAVTLWNTISAVATAATTAFGAAVAFLTSPIGLVTVAIGAVIAIVLLLIKHWDEVKEAAGAAWEFVQEKWNAAAGWFNETVVEPVVEFFEGLFEDIRQSAANAWENVQTIWGVVSGWFHEKVIQPVAEFFGGLWEGVKTGAGDLWEKVKGVWDKAAKWFEDHVTKPIQKAFEAAGTTVKNTINGLIGNVEGMINGVIKGVNWLIDKLNTISFSVPDWVPGVGGKSFGINIRPVSEVKLPRLANGAVIPPNQQFAAILGDQRSGTNIEAPLSTIEQAVKNAIAQSGGLTGNATVEIPVNLDGRTIARVVVPHINDMTRSAGKPVLLY